MRVLCIGHATYDISCMLDNYPVENTKNVVNEKLEVGGGQAANEACLLAKWGVETYLAAVIGSDTYGEKIKNELNTFGVKQDLIETSFDKATSTSFILINKANGSRTVFSLAKPEDEPHIKRTEVIVEPDIILTDGYEFHMSVNAINKYPDKISVIDAGRVTTEVVEIAKLCKYIVCSKDFAEGLTGLKFDFANPTTLTNVYNRLKERYPKSEIIITLEGNGALYVQNNQIKIMPGLKIDVVDTTAAGDIFHGAFVYGLLNNYDIEKCIAYANIAAGLSCASTGGKLSIPNLNNVITYYNNKTGVQNAQQQQPVQQPIQEPVQPAPNPNQPNTQA